MKSRHVAVLAARSGTRSSLRCRERRMREVMSDVAVGFSCNELTPAVLGGALTSTCCAAVGLRNVEDRTVPSFAEGKPYAIAGEEGMANLGKSCQRIHDIIIWNNQKRFSLTSSRQPNAQTTSRQPDMNQIKQDMLQFHCVESD